jgi:hypothetical protein
MIGWRDRCFTSLRSTEASRAPLAPVVFIRKEIRRGWCESFQPCDTGCDMAAKQMPKQLPRSLAELPPCPRVSELCGMWQLLPRETFTRVRPDLGQWITAPWAPAMQTQSFQSKRSRGVNGVISSLISAAKRAASTARKWAKDVDRLMAAKARLRASRTTWPTAAV